MPLNYYALLFGVLIAGLVIVTFHKTDWSPNGWAFPTLLASFPAYYWVFAVYGNDYVALRYELIAGVGFIVMSVYAWQKKNTAGMVILAIGYIAHALYDVVHDKLFINAGMPGWWPEFCGAADLILGLYVGYLAWSSAKTAGPESINPHES